jgi:hypothetical protein
MFLRMRINKMLNKSLFFNDYNWKDKINFNFLSKIMFRLNDFTNC